MLALRTLRAEPEDQAGPDWDVTVAVLDALIAMEGGPAKRIGLWMTAGGCPGCDQLSDQLEANAAALADVELLRLEVGDLGESQIRALAVGSATLTTPGFPVIWLLEPTGPRAVDLVAVSLGPLDSWRVAEDLSTLLGGASRWVAEAAYLSLEVCAGGMCFPLSASNDFQQRVTIALPE